MSCGGPIRSRSLGIVGVVAAQTVLRAWRWSILLPARADGTRVSARRLVAPMLVGYLGNAVLPARMGEPMRAVIASRRERTGTTEALGSVLVERVIDITTLALVGFVAAFVLAGPGVDHPVARQSRAPSASPA